MNSADRWTSDSGLTEWIDGEDRMDRLLQPLGAVLREAADLRPGEHVVDIGCGTGSTAIAAWFAVQPGGTVTGLDISPQMIERASERSAEARAGVRYVVADAQTYLLAPGAADVAISRFGVGHFSDTSAAFANIASGLRPGGRFVFAEWAAGQPNEWMTLVGDVARMAWPDRAVPASAPVHAPDFDDRAMLTAAAEASGLVVESLQLVARDLPIGVDVPDVLAWFEQLPERRILDGVDAALQRAFYGRLTEELRARQHADGVCLKGTAWLATCQKRASV